MKNQTKTNYGCAIVILMGLMAATLLWQRTPAQSNVPIAKRGDVFSVHYMVSIVGEFSKEPEPGKEDPTIYYHIKRFYTGDAKVSFSGNSTDPKMDAPLFKDPAALVVVKINDFVESLYPPICGEYETIETKCTATDSSGNAVVPVPAMLLFDNVQGTLSASFPLAYSPANKGIGCTTQRFDNPGHEASGKPEIRYQTVGSLMPNVTGFIDGGRFHHKLEWSKLKQDGSSLSWMSEVLHPEQPLVDGLPDSKDKVDIIISYDITRN